MSLVAVAVCAFFLSSGLAAAVDRLSLRERQLMEIATVSSKLRWLRGGGIVVSGVLLMALFFWASIDLKCLETAEVQPSLLGRYWRFGYHAMLIGLLIAATAIDFDCYVIPDEITLTGVIIGLLGACLTREVQICHLWVDWSVAVPQLRGPYIPSWYDTHRFWHAIAWSVAGVLAGAGLTQIARLVSSWVLGQEAMGFGDVTLMGMIGSFIGWQAVTLVFLIAPLMGLIIGLLIRIVSGKTYVPYGPWLSIAAVVVLFFWSQLWAHSRLIFSDWVSVLTLGGVGGGGFVVLLFMLQLYKAIPTRAKPS